MRYKYRTIEVDPANEAATEATLAEYADAGWRLHSVIPTYATVFTYPPDSNHPDDVHVGTARMIFEREREHG